jgi:hypothetical protein
MMDNAQAGGSRAGRNVPVNNQNIVIDQAANNAAAQMAQQILANTNVTLKQELVKIQDFWGEKSKDTVTATQFMARIDECQVANDWYNTTTYANFSLRGRLMAGIHRQATGSHGSPENMDMHSPTFQKGIRRSF